MPPTIAERLHGRDNNFNLIRFAAASLVLLDHCLMLGAGGPYSDRLLGTLPWNPDLYALGHLAVDSFFIVSGFLVTRSVLTRPTLLDFGVARILRLFPALILVCLLVAFLLGPAVTTLSWSAYFSDLKTWLYTPLSAGLVTDNATLPGVFAHSLDPNVVNHPLWTLRYEASCYLLLAALAFVGAFSHRRILYVLAGMLAAYLLVTLGTGWRGDLAAFDSAVRFVLAFFVGGGLYLFRDRIRLSWIPMAALVALAAISLHTRLAELTLTLALAYGLIWFALGPAGAIRNFNRLGDYSYGIYIMCWPVQQTIVMVKPDIGVLPLFVVSFAITLVLAVASWHFVEHPALRRKDSVSKAMHAKLGALQSRFAFGTRKSQPAASRPEA